MSKEDFKTIYKSQYSAQGTLANEIMPRQAENAITLIILAEAGNKDSLLGLIGWLAANMPPYKKFIPKYDELKEKLNECRKVAKEWRKMNNMKDYDTVLYDKLYELYEAWWEAYNESGAGLTGIPFDPHRDVKIRNAITGAAQRSS